MHAPIAGVCLNCRRLRAGGVLFVPSPKDRLEEKRKRNPISNPMENFVGISEKVFVEEKRHHSDIG